MSRLPTKGVDYTDKDYEAFRNSMIEKLKTLMPEYTDLRQSDAGIVLLELLAQGLDVISYYQDVLANEVFLSTSVMRDNVLKWCQMLGYHPKHATAAKFKQVFVLKSIQDHPITLFKDERIKTQATADEPSIYFGLDKNLVIPAGKRGDEVDEHGNYLYSVSVSQGILVRNEIVGTSTGVPNQTFKLGYTPVLYDSIQLVINEGKGYNPWFRVDNFVDSKPDSHHYTAEVNDLGEVIITFGDGVFGKIPTPFEGGIRSWYKVGGGTQGNVGANKITVLDSDFYYVERTFNPDLAYVEGQDEETIEEIKINAPNSFRTKWGALTREDFEDVVRSNFTYVRDASCVTIPGPLNNTSVDIYVLTKSGSPLSESQNREIHDLFDPLYGGRSIVGVRSIKIKDCLRKSTDISITLTIKDRYSFSEVKKSVETFVTDYFSVGSFKIGEDVSISELVSEIMNPGNAIEGVLAVRITSPESDVIKISDDSIITLGSLTISQGGV